jgi:transcriptional regulator with XRE-family HTH domain
MKTKKEEALALRSAYRMARAREEHLTQDSLAHELGVTQALVSHWMTGMTRIPDTTLLLLSVRLGFDPVEVRPEIATDFALAKKILTNDDLVDELREKLDRLTKEELDQVELLAEMLLLRRERGAKG